LSALARCYAIARCRPSNIDRFIEAADSNSGTEVLTWTAIALHRGGYTREGLQLFDLAKGQKSVFAHSIRCSIALNVNALELSRALREFFNDQGFNDQELQTAYLRLAISLLALDAVDLRSVEIEFTSLLHAQLTARKIQPVLSDLIRIQSRPWLAMVIAFADSLTIPYQEIADLLENPEERSIVRQRLRFARSWKPSPFNQIVNHSTY
jgi:hypothetical protein